MDELFEALTLVQTRKVTRFPVVLMGTAYWQGLIDWIRDTMAADGKISPSDLDLICVTDDVDEAVRHIVRNADPGASARRLARGTGLMASICVFCASSQRLERAWLDLAADVGTRAGRRGHIAGLRRRPGRHDGRGRRRRPRRRARTPSA